MTVGEIDGHSADDTRSHITWTQTPVKKCFLLTGLTITSSYVFTAQPLYFYLFDSNEAIGDLLASTGSRKFFTTIVNQADAIAMDQSVQSVNLIFDPPIRFDIVVRVYCEPVPYTLAGQNFNMAATFQGFFQEL
jgi:hypothetical protein